MVLKDSLGGTTFDRCIKSIQVVVFSKATIIGITSSTCRHFTLSIILLCAEVQCIVRFVFVYMVVVYM